MPFTRVLEVDTVDTVYCRPENRAEIFPVSQNADIQALKGKIEQLYLEHRDLDDVIQHLIETTPHDQLKVQRLKKRKLFVKDQINALERQLTPDIPA